MLRGVSRTGLARGWSPLSLSTMLFRTTALLALVLSTVPARVAQAHEDQAFHLAGVRFCVDPASVQVQLELPSPARTRSAERALKAELQAALAVTLARSQVSHLLQDSCSSSRAYTRLLAEVRYLDPETYIGFGQRSYSYTLSLQVGTFAGRKSAEGVEQLPTPTYSAFVSDIYPEAEERPFEPFVAHEGERLVQGLAAYWWEDNPQRPLRATLLPPLLGSLLALLSGAALLWALRRRRAGRTEPYSSSG